MNDISILKGKILSSIINNNDELIFTTTEGKKYRLVHQQDCCELVYM